MLRYIADSLLHSAKARGSIPDGAFSAPELLQIASEELEGYLMPLIVSAQEDYYETDQDFPILVDPGANTLPTVEYRAPSRAIGGALKDVMFIDSGGRPVDVPRIATTDLEGASWGFIMQSQSVRYLNRMNRSDIVTLRMKFALSPNALCSAAQAAIVSAINGNAITLSSIPAPAWPLDEPAEGPAPLSMVGDTSFDFIRSTPGFELVAFDQAGTCDGAVVTLTGTAPSGLQVGDYVAAAGYSPVPQAPTAMWSLLAQAIAAALLNQTGAGDEEEKALQKRKLIEQQTLPLIQNRVRGAPRSIIARHNILQASKRW